MVSQCGAGYWGGLGYPLNCATCPAGSFCPSGMPVFEGDHRCLQAMVKNDLDMDMRGGLCKLDLILVVVMACDYIFFLEHFFSASSPIIIHRRCHPSHMPPWLCVCSGSDETCSLLGGRLLPHCWRQCGESVCGGVFQFSFGSNQLHVVSQLDILPPGRLEFHHHVHSGHLLPCIGS